MPVLFSIATIEARGPEAKGSQLRIAVVGRLLDLGVERRLDGQAARERAPGAELAAAELVDDLLLDPGGEVGVLRVLARGRDVGARGQALGRGGVVLRLVDQALLEHAVAARRCGACAASAGCATGSKPLGEATMPASSAASWSSSWAAHGRVLSCSQPWWSPPK